MSAKVLVVFCAQAFLAHVVIGQCAYPRPTPPIAAPSCGVLPGPPISIGNSCGGANIGISGGYIGAGLSPASYDVVPTSGGGLSVSSSSALAPSGISVASENVFEGSIAVIGELPFLSAAAFESVLPSAGAGVVNYGCGNGVTAILGESSNAVGSIGLAPPSVIGYGSAGIVPAPYGCGSSLAAIPPSAISLGFPGQVCGCAGY